MTVAVMYSLRLHFFLSVSGPIPEHAPEKNEIFVACMCHSAGMKYDGVNPVIDEQK